jgi:phage protein U
MQEIQDFLFLERGMDTDQAFNIQLRKVDETLKSLNANASDASISSLTPERKA